MDNLIWIGALISLAGVGLLFRVILLTLRARRDAEDDEALKAALQRLAAINFGALAISAVGLMIVVIGIAFG